jgi:hypothetical protein
MTDERVADNATPGQPDPEVVTQRLDDELVVVHLRTNRIFLLNRTGARYWELLDSGADFDQIKERMLQEFAVEEDVLLNEIDEFRRKLRNEELIRGDDG